MRRCNHPPMSSFIAFKGKNGATVWRCSHCGKEDVWRDGWEYFGSMECRCGNAGVYGVTCSDTCRAAWKPTDARTALEVAQSGSPEGGR